MRQTLEIRGIMRSHGINLIWTNKYKTKRTVKCYAPFDEKDARALIIDLKMAGYSVDMRKRSHGAFRSIIVDALLQ